jgi:hypothetical protein
MRIGANRRWRFGSVVKFSTTSAACDDLNYPGILAHWPKEMTTVRSYLGGRIEIRTVTTLRNKRAEMISSIARYEKRIAQARADLSHVNACIALFEAMGEHGARTSYVGTHRKFA